MPRGIASPVRKGGNGIVGYRTPSMFDLDSPVKFQGRDHSQRPAGSTKRLGRKRGKGGGGVQGAMDRLAASLEARHG
jgi:hypothetical protein